MQTGTILDEIIAAKRAEVVELRAAGYFSALRRKVVPFREIRDFAAALRDGIGGKFLPPPPAASRRRVRLIAEIKRASPSKGVLRADLDPVAQARIYAANGAAAISVLTERRYFQGDPSDLRAVRAAVNLPLLRKDFIVDADQVFESRAIGADAILLIVAALTDGELETFLGLAGELGLHCLVEVHTEAELVRALAAGARLIGVNNRDLRTFRVDLEVTRRLARHVPFECTLVAESGIFTAEDVRRAGEWGAHAVLVGEALVRDADAAAKVRELAGAAGAATA